MKKTAYAFKMGVAFVALALGSTSCTRYYYRPNSVNAPLLANAGDVHIVANAMPVETEEINDTRAKNNVRGVQLAVSPFKYIGLIGGYTNYHYKITQNPRPETGLVDGKANIWEIGAGGYYVLQERKSGTKLLVDCYAGYGWGSMKSDVDMGINKIFIQPGIGVRMPYFEASFNLRCTGIKYSNLQAKGLPDYYLSDNRLVNDNGTGIVSSRHFFMEPAFTIRGGYKFIKAQMQVAFARHITNVTWQYNESLFTAGLYFGLEELLRLKR